MWAIFNCFIPLTACFSSFSFKCPWELDLSASLQTRLWQIEIISSHLPHVWEFFSINTTNVNQIFHTVNLQSKYFQRNLKYSSLKSDSGGHLSFNWDTWLRLKLGRIPEGTSRGQNSQTNTNELTQYPREAHFSPREVETNTTNAAVVKTCWQ